MSRDTAKRYKKSPLDPNAPNPGAPVVTRKLPFETVEEFRRFQTFLHSTPRSVREAYRNYCEEAGKQPKADPPSNWFQLARGEYLAIRQATQREKAIENAGGKHGRFADWEAIEHIVEAAIDAGELDPEVYRGEFGEIMTLIKETEVGFTSLAIDIHGDPLPGVLTWIERSAAEGSREGAA